MPTWLAALLAVAAILCPIAVTYHNRFVPDVETQKKQLKFIAGWAVEVVCIGCEVAIVAATVYMAPQPLPAWWAALIAYAVSSVLMLIIGLFLGHVIRRDRRKLNDAISRHRTALVFLALSVASQADYDEFMSLIDGTERPKRPQIPGGW